MPVWYKIPIYWIDFPAEGCEMYRSKDRWQDAFIDHYYEDDDDIL